MGNTSNKTLFDILTDMRDDVEKLWADWLVFKKGGAQ